MIISIHFVKKTYELGSIFLQNLKKNFDIFFKKEYGKKERKRLDMVYIIITAH